jgi:signal peptidase I
MNTTSSIKTARRKPSDALSLATMLPGLGQIYCGKFVAGMLWMGISIFLLIAAIIAIMMDSGKSGLIVGAVLFGIEIVLWTFNLFITWRLAKNTPPDYLLREYNRWYIYMIFILIASVGTAAGVAFVVRERVVQAFVVPTSSMSPTINSGDRLIALKEVFFDRDPERAELVVFRNPEKRRMFYVGRVIATAGDTVEWRENGDVLVNDELLPHTPNTEPGKFTEVNGDKSYSIRLTPPETVGEESKSGRVVVPPYHGFVMGDNRFNAKDSRHYGALPYANLHAKPVAKFWGKGKLQ